MHQSRELTRDRGLELAHRARRVPQNRGDDGGGRIAAERPFPGQHLVEHDAQRENVRTRIDRLAFSLLGRHVRGSPDDVSFLRRRSGQELVAVATRQLEVSPWRGQSRAL